MNQETNRILLSQGGGGEESWRLITDLFLKYFSNPVLDALEDSAVIALDENQQGNLAFTTDSFTVSPLFFKGGDIGKLAVDGTANDLAVMGAKPLYLSAGFIIEEGFAYPELEKIVESMAREAKTAGVKIVTGDTKVVPRGQADKLFINTSGIGEIVRQGLSASHIQQDAAIIVSGSLGDHGACIMASRQGIDLDADIASDCRPVWDLVSAVLQSAATVYAMRDPTRGGLSAVLNEWAQKSNVEIEVEEEKIPFKNAVMGLCELLGFDPLHLASEGRVIFALSAQHVEKVLTILKNHPAGKEATVIGKIIKKGKGRVILRTPYGTRRIMEPPVGELLPRIC